MKQIDEQLFQAIWTNNFIEVEGLVANGASLAAHDTEGFSVISAAIACGITMLKRLIQLGADPCLCDRDGTPSISTAIASGDINIVAELLTAGANLNLNDDRGGNALHAAAGLGDVEIFELLLGFAVAADVKSKNPNGDTPLDIARLIGHGEIVSLLTAAEGQIE